MTTAPVAPEVQSGATAGNDEAAGVQPAASVEQSANPRNGSEQLT